MLTDLRVSGLILAILYTHTGVVEKQMWASHDFLSVKITSLLVGLSEGLHGNY